MNSEPLAHTPRQLSGPRGWVFLFAHSRPKRLVVFVHGFRGGATRSWRNFPDGGKERRWWRESDLLFVGYPSHRDNIAATAYRLRQEVPRFYPSLPHEFLEVDGIALASRSDTLYEELILVGHSLGGVVIRRALIDAAEEWAQQLAVDPQAPRPKPLDAKVYLFSPATAGFRPAGWLGFLRSGPAWTLIEMQLRRASAYSDLQQGSEILEHTKRRTEAALGGSRVSDLSALRAQILWANPDDVVIAERYDTDFVDHFIDGQDHGSLCKPHEMYPTPWNFVERGTT